MRYDVCVCVSLSLNGGYYRRHPKRPFPLIYDVRINHAKDTTTTTTTPKNTSILLCVYCVSFALLFVGKTRDRGELTRWLSGNDRWRFPSGRHLSERWRNCSASWRCWVASAIQTCWAKRRKTKIIRIARMWGGDIFKHKMRYRSGLESISHSCSVCVCRLGISKARVK